MTVLVTLCDPSALDCVIVREVYNMPNVRT